MANLGQWISGTNYAWNDGDFGFTSNARMKVELLSQNASTNTSVVRYTSAVYWNGDSIMHDANLYDTCAGVVLYNANLRITAGSGMGYPVFQGLLYCITRDRTITHDANGNASFSATHQWGSGSVSASYTLPQINREAYITSVDNLWAEGNTSMQISNPAGYWLNLEFFVWDGWDYEPRILNVRIGQVTSYATAFTQEERNAIYTQMGNATQGAGLFRIRSYSDANYTNQVGNYRDAGMTVFVDTTHREAYITNTPNFTVGQNLALSIHNPRSYWLKLLVFVAKDADYGDPIMNINIGQVRSYTTAFTQAQINAIYLRMKEKIKSGNLFRIHSYSDSGYINQVGELKYILGTTSIDTAINTPTFPNCDLVSENKTIIVKDSYNNTLATNQTNTLTGSNQKVISGVSQIKASITSANKMVAKNQADPVRYRLVNGDKLVEASYKASETVNLVLDNITSKDAVVTAYDSRGLATPVSKSFTNIANYTSPTAWSLAFTRDNNVDEKTKLSIAGKFWKQYFGGGTSGVQNTITAHYRYKETTQSWGSQTWNTLAVTSNAEGDISFNNYINGDLGVNGFNKDKSYSIEVRLYDKISALIVSGVLNKGTPLLDWTVDGVAIKSKYDPVKGGSLQVDGENIASGWSLVADTWSFGSVDNPTGVINWTGANSKVSVGMRIRFVNGGNTIYGIVTAVTGSTMTFLHEVSSNVAVHLMANSAITNPCISAYKAPLGFPSNPDRWSIKVEDFGTNRNVVGANAGTWYNLGGVAMGIPIGVWRLSFSVLGQIDGDASADNMKILNTSLGETSSSSLPLFLATIGSKTNALRFNSNKEGVVQVATKKTYYLNTMSPDGVRDLYNLNGIAPARLQATCVYL